MTGTYSRTLIPPSTAAPAQKPEITLLSLRNLPSGDRVADRYWQKTGEVLNLTDLEVQRHKFQLSQYMRENFDEITKGATKLTLVKQHILDEIRTNPT